MRRFGVRRVVALGTAAVVASGVVAASSASAGPTDIGAITSWAQAFEAATLSAVSGATGSGDNLTCDPEPTVGAEVVNPRAQYVVGELYGHAALVGHWKCASLDTHKTYTITGQVADYYYSSGSYRQWASSPYTTSSSIAGTATTTPTLITSYPGGSPALNTWHYARMDGWTSTGRHVWAISQLYYVSGN